jgi:hypothetical protein
MLLISKSARVLANRSHAGLSKRGLALIAFWSSLSQYATHSVFHRGGRKPQGIGTKAGPNKAACL